MLPSADGFDPDAYLAVFHDTTTLPELQAGMRTLDKELSERTGQLKQLVRVLSKISKAQYCVFGMDVGCTSGMCDEYTLWHVWKIYLLAVRTRLD